MKRAFSLSLSMGQLAFLVGALSVGCGPAQGGHGIAMPEDGGDDAPPELGPDVGKPPKVDGRGGSPVDIGGAGGTAGQGAGGNAGSAGGMGGSGSGGSVPDAAAPPDLAAGGSG